MTVLHTLLTMLNKNNSIQSYMRDGGQWFSAPTAVILFNCHRYLCGPNQGHCSFLILKQTITYALYMCRSVKDNGHTHTYFKYL